MSSLSSEELLHLGHLARLALTEEERERYASQLSRVVEYVDQLAEVDTSAVTELRGVSGLTNMLADDAPRSADDLAAVDHKELVAGAPLSEGDLIVVRAVLGGEVASA